MVKRIRRQRRYTLSHDTTILQDKGRAHESLCFLTPDGGTILLGWCYVRYA
jgi:hypothetical protein